VTTWISLVTGGSGALVVMAAGLYLFYKNKLHSHAEFMRLLKAFEDSEKAHSVTREALVLANARAEAGLKPAEIIAAVLSGQKASGP
jgi:hypothetical protein